jgi:hypothetical protein
MFLSCPAHLDPDGGAQCGLPAEIVRRFTMHSTDGSLAAAMIRCPVGHWFNGPIEALIRNGTHPHGSSTAGRGARAGHDSLEHDHHGRGECGGRPVWDQAAGPERVDRRSNPGRDPDPAGAAAPTPATSPPTIRSRRRDPPTAACPYG